MYCPNCGKQMPDDAKYCDGCGSSLNDQVKAAMPPAYAPVPPPVANPTMQQPYTTPQANYYQQPAQAVHDLNAPMSVGAYIGTFLLMCIPLANIILLFVWAFGSDVNKNKKNLARAGLIFLAIAVAVYIVVAVAMGGILASLYADMNY